MAEPLNLNQILQRAELTPQGPTAKTADVTGDRNFTDVLRDAIEDVNKLQHESDGKMASLLKGESQDLHGTILAVQQADSSFRMMMQVRNKIVEAYKEISRSAM